MFFLTIIFSSLMVVGRTQFLTPEKPLCKLYDSQCLNKVMYQVSERVFNEVPSFNYDPYEEIDPMFFEYIEGNLNLINYKLFNTTVTGFRKCEFAYVDIDTKKSQMQSNLRCPSGTRIVGGYELTGDIIDWHFQGKGDYEFILGSFDVKVNARLGLYEAKDQKVYLKIKGFISNAKVTSPFKAQLTNLLERNVKNSDAVFPQYTYTSIPQQQQKQLADILQEPILMSSFKKIFRKANRYLKNLHFEQ